MDKYKDFQDLKDTDEMTLRRLFVKRNYSKYVKDPQADDITNPMDGVFLFPENTDIESAKFEISFLKPSEIEHRYLRKRVEAYLKVCRDIVNEESDQSEETEKPYNSLNRVYSFILAEAHNRGEVKIAFCTVKKFNEIVKEKFDIDKPREIYLRVRCYYKKEKHYIHYFDEMKRTYFKDYEYAMKIFKNYYPNLI